MATFDTNVIVRLAVEDDPSQSRRAEAAWRAALAADGVFVPKVVVVETTWVLRTSYGFDRAAVAAVLRRLLGIQGVAAEDEPQVWRALSEFERGPGDLSDYLIVESAREADSLPVLTFDAAFARVERVRLVDPESQPAD